MRDLLVRTPSRFEGSAHEQMVSARVPGCVIRESRIASLASRYNTVRPFDMRLVRSSVRHCSDLEIAVSFEGKQDALLTPRQRLMMCSARFSTLSAASLTASLNVG